VIFGGIESKKTENQFLMSIVRIPLAGSNRTFAKPVETFFEVAITSDSSPAKK
jgi:hypothetical protein